MLSFQEINHKKISEVHKKTPYSPTSYPPPQFRNLKIVPKATAKGRWSYYQLCLLNFKGM